MIYKFIFSIYGDSLYPEKVINKIDGKFSVDSYFSPTDKRSNGETNNGFGAVSFWHPKKFATDNLIEEYEEAYVNFIEKNYQLFISHGADEFEIFMEIYFDGGQCNFEIFNKDLLKKLSVFEVSLPISFYVLKSNEFEKWEKEIQVNWKE